ncbi:MAG: hypothetical protein RR643_05005 [Anaerorhabdus sp.]|uniref:hypothetical protein n=1 Tax=Anaerorhabdus sp. TaxID=1872524 RepID=UPI002FCC3918
MAVTKRLIWDKVGEREYETGTSKGVLFTQDTAGAYSEGIAWNGLVSVTQSPDGAEANDQFADNIVYVSLTSAENFKGNISAFTYPDEFGACDGSADVVPGVTIGQQTRQPFAMSYQTIVGNDTLGNDFGKKIHVIYGAKVAPSERGYETVNADPSLITFSWDFTTTPVVLENFKPTAYIAIDSTKVNPAIFKAVEDAIYGTETVASKLPPLEDLIKLIKTTSTTTTTTKAV